MYFFHYIIEYLIKKMKIKLFIASITLLMFQKNYSQQFEYKVFSTIESVVKTKKIGIGGLIAERSRMISEAEDLDYNDTTTLIGLHQHLVPFRATPTFSYSSLSHFDLEPFDAQPTSLSANASGNLYQSSVSAKDPTARTRGFGGTITCDSSAGYFDFSAEL